MTQKSILITGCSSGIGYDAAHTLQKRGWQVFATCRQQKDCDRLIAEGLNSFVLDYDSSDSIKAALATALEQTGGTLDALFNNGAFALAGLTQDTPRDALRAIFETNFFGPFELITETLPIMQKQGHGRIINNSSILGLLAMRGRGPYNATKFAMEGYTDTMRAEFYGKSDIKFVLIEPGPITTNIRQNAQKQFEKWIDWENSTAKGFYQNVLLPRLYDDSGNKDPGELPPSAVTDVLITALEHPNPRPRYLVTRPAKIGALMKRFVPTRILDRLVQKM